MNVQKCKFMLFINFRIDGGHVENNKQRNIKKSDSINYPKPQYLMKEVVSAKSKGYMKFLNKSGKIMT